MITEEKINRFLDGSATSQEAEEVHTYFLNNPDALDRYINSEEWNNTTAKQLPAKTEADMDKVVLSKTVAAKLSENFKYLAAASVIGIIILAAYIIPSFNKINSESLYAIAKEDSLTNYSQAIKIIKLIDGSAISLYPGSALYYPSAFEEDNRTVRLKGKARFDVAQDRKKPFTVISSDITTTALGTIFIVDGTDTGNIAVSLIEGKVVLKPLREAKFKAVYLNPNEKCIIHKKDYRISLQSINDEPLFKNNIISKKHLRNTQIAKENQPDFIDATPIEDALDFNQTPLYHVFNVLAGNYPLKISYNKKDVEHLYFTGNFKKEQQINTILKIICDMNGLEAVATKDRIRISKK
ncbi:FecR family protein [Haoranjiania flava]|uniref:FecR family protein n=1 Tax=Haoranjiania flava TaxID=1856322 RepID=A0AAE3IL52_9BACT|nr:FecR family protein [Haoranjiania flava]MCU7693864.1 FecR family protein [Haoranjiania flava]